MSGAEGCLKTGLVHSRMAVKGLVRIKKKAMVPGQGGKDGIEKIDSKQV